MTITSIWLAVAVPSFLLGMYVEHLMLKKKMELLSNFNSVKGYLWQSVEYVLQNYDNSSLRYCAKLQGLNIATDSWQLAFLYNSHLKNVPEERIRAIFGLEDPDEISNLTGNERLALSIISTWDALSEKELLHASGFDERLEAFKNCRKPSPLFSTEWKYFIETEGEFDNLSLALNFFPKQKNGYMREYILCAEKAILLARNVEDIHELLGKGVQSESKVLWEHLYIRLAELEDDIDNLSDILVATKSTSGKPYEVALERIVQLKKSKPI